MGTERYEIAETIHDGASTVIHRGRRVADGAPVLLKVLRSDRPGAREVARLRHEHDIAASIASPFVVHPLGLDEHEGRPALVYEDFGGRSLDRLLRDGPLAPARFLEIAPRLAAALADVHRHGIVHKDVKPENAIVHPATGETRLTDFGIASLAPREDRAAASPARIEGTLAYMSPEQTGRMGRPVDARSDLYSLGVTFFEMLAGRLPFDAGDPVEWAHCHIARPPPDLGKVRPDVPAPLAAIVAKLLQKDPEDRYQSARGLRHDLDRCAREHATSGRIEPFALGGRDVADRLRLPDRLYGRDAEVRALEAAFERVLGEGRPALALISGESGAGKTALAREVEKAAARRRAEFAAGKFDPAERDLPYAAVARALGSLVERTLAASERRLGEVRGRLRDALGDDAAHVAPLIPALRLILEPAGAPAAAPPPGGPLDIGLALRRLLAAFVAPGSPVVLFLDDVQWADPASLALLPKLLQFGEGPLLVLAALREEPGPRPPALDAVAGVEALGVPVERLALAPLDDASVARLLSDALQAQTRPLASLVRGRTGGNPFFVAQFLAALGAEGLVRFDADAAAWRWDLDAIAKRSYTDNVSDLVLARLERLPEAARSALRLAACLGDTADLATLALVAGPSTGLRTGRPEEDLRRDLAPAFREEIAIDLGGAVKFLHDRIRQAAYSTIPEEERAAVHLRIARALMGGAPPEGAGERIFEIVRHLDAGAGLIEDEEERARAAALHLAAGRRAKAASAFPTAVEHLSRGIALLPEGSWDARRDLAFDLHLQRADCAFLGGDAPSADRDLAALMDRARTDLERAHLLYVKLTMQVAKGDFAGAVEAALEALRVLGVEVSARPGREGALRACEDVWRAVGDRPIEALLDLPPLADPRLRAAMEVLHVIFPAAFFLDENLVLETLARMVAISARHGPSEPSALAYVCFGGLMGPLFGRYEDGYRFARLANDLVADRPLSRERSGVRAQFHSKVSFWARPLERDVESLREWQREAIERGEMIGAFYLAEHVTSVRWVQGDDLALVHAECERSLEFLGETRSMGVADLVLARDRLVQALRGLTPGLGSLDGDGFEERAFEERIAGAPPLTRCVYLVMKLICRFMAGDRDAAAEAGRVAAEVIGTAVSDQLYADFVLFDGLARAGLATSTSTSTSTRDEDLAVLRAREAKSAEWEASCPSTFRCRRALVAAELARVEGRDLEAIGLYERAVRAAREDRFIHIEALANELAARFHLDRGHDVAGLAHLREARSCYARWGADGKVRQLEARRPALREGEAAGPRTTFTAGPEQLDLLSVVKASQTISSEMVLGNLLGTIVRIAIEHAGAERGHLVLVRGDDLRIEASAGPEPAEGGAAPRNGERLPRSVLDFARRTGDPVILGDADAPGPFAADPHFLRARPRSVLCLPVRRQGRTVALLYLENDLTAGAFTADRLAVLNLLATQAGISIENASLLADLQASRARLQAVLDHASAVVFIKDAAGRYVLVNREFERVIGLPKERIHGRTDEDLFPRETAGRLRATDRQVLDGGHPLTHEVSIPLPAGARTFVVVKSALSEGGGAAAVCGIATDVTDRKAAEEALRKSEEKLRQAQKMEAIGRLAGGIAHDFNNVLVAMMGYAELAMRRLAPGDKLRDRIDVIQRAGTQAAALTRQLLTFTRQQPLRPQVIDLNEVVTQTLGMLARTIGEDIEISCVLAPDLGRVRADPGQVAQVVMNLAVNARDAMPRGGRLTIETSNVTVDPDRASGQPVLAPGPHVLLAVSDTGCGMDEATRARLFEPFFTTKELGKGTGLGLATVYAIVQQSGGAIAVYSEPGRGATFRIYLPRVDAPAEPIRAPVGAAAALRGTETILLVDDDRLVRSLVREVLSDCGYTVLAARGGAEALDLCGRHDGPIHLLLTDVVLPQMNGRDLAEKALEARPGLKVVFMSGYAPGAVLNHGHLGAGADFIEKPFTPDAIARKVREALG